MSVVLYGAIIVLCLGLSAFFSSSETALFRLRSHDIDEEVESGNGPAAIAVRDLTASSSRLLVTILLGNNIVNILGASVASALAVHYLGPRVGIPVATVIMTVLVLILCEVLPKAVAARHPRGVARMVGLPLYLFHGMLAPVHAVFDRAIEPMVRKLTGGEESGALGSEEVLRLARAVREDQEQGSPMAIIGATSEAAEMDVSEIMVQRTEIIAFPIETPPPELLDKVLSERYTRVPIYEDSIDNILGMIHLKDLMKLVRRGAGAELRHILKPVLRVPERKPILRLLSEMQRAFCHVALVKDEFGVTLGLVTQEDILEEIVGEIRDEFDSEELLDIRKLWDGSYDVMSHVSVLDFNRESGWNIPAERGDTMGGLIFNTVERPPRKGEVLKVAGYQFICIEVVGGRLTRVRVTQSPGEELEKED